MIMNRAEDDVYRRGENDEVSRLQRSERVAAIDFSDLCGRGLPGLKPGPSVLRPGSPLSCEGDRSANQARTNDGDLHWRISATGSARAGRCPVHRAQPRLATGSRQMLRPMAGAMMRNSAISRSNWLGNIDCAPSLNA
jgi:hypothetical protein